MFLKQSTYKLLSLKIVNALHSSHQVKCPNAHVDTAPKMYVYTLVFHVSCGICHGLTIPV